MDQHRDALESNEQREMQLDWQADRTQLQENLVSLHKAIDRLHAMRAGYRDLIECAQLNIQNVAALRNDLNSLVVQFGFLPLPERTLEWEAIQRRLSSTYALRRMSEEAHK